MITTEAWWEDIFQGNLALGINKERFSEIEEEDFLYFEAGNSEEAEDEHSYLELNSHKHN